MDAAERILWQLRAPERDVLCVMRTCCAGAELQIRTRTRDDAADETIAVRELYPSKSDLYERARQLARHYGAAPGAGR